MTARRRAVSPEQLGVRRLGWVAGDMAVSDPAIKDWVDANANWLHTVAPAIGAIGVVAVGKWLASRAESHPKEGPEVDLAKAGSGEPGAK